MIECFDKVDIGWWSERLALSTRQRVDLCAPSVSVRTCRASPMEAGAASILPDSSVAIVAEAEVPGFRRSRLRPPKFFAAIRIRRACQMRSSMSLVSPTPKKFAAPFLAFLHTIVYNVYNSLNKRLNFDNRTWEWWNWWVMSSVQSLANDIYNTWILTLKPPNMNKI